MNAKMRADRVIVTGKSPTELKALQLALNRIPLDASWDDQNVRNILEELVRVDFDLDLTGFDALLGYGIPGMLFEPFFGHLADRVGRKRIIPLGILIGALVGAAFIPHMPLLWPIAITAFLSLGYDMSHPLLAGISTSLNPSRRGLAMGMNSFSLFSGFWFWRVGL